MSKLSGFLAGAMVALMSMPPSINLLGFVGGELPLSLAPLVITFGFLTGVSVFFTQFGQSKRLLGATNRYLLLFLLLATFSVLWSGFPTVTAYRLYRLYAMFFICFAFSMTAWTPHKFSASMQGAMMFLTIGSILLVMVSPDDAIQESVFNGMVLPELVGAWRGITTHKNTLGSVASAAVIICFHSLYVRNGSRIYSGIGLLLALICLIKSRSSTSMFAAVFAIALILLILKSPFVKKRRTIRIFSFILAIFFLIYSLGILNIIPGLSAIVEPIVAMTGKDMTFSGRTIIWLIMKDEILKHPLLGTGYAAFWLGPDPMSPSIIFKIRMYLDPGEAHNGYLDVINELGFVGVAILIAYLFTFLRQTVSIIAYDRNKSALFIGLLFAELIANMSEAHWLNLASVNFFILTLATFDMGRTILEMKRKKAADKARQTRPAARPAHLPPAFVQPVVEHQDRLAKE